MDYQVGTYVFVRIETGRHGIWTVIRDIGNRVIVAREESQCENDTTSDTSIHVVETVDKVNVFHSTVACIDASSLAIQNIPFPHDNNMIIENMIIERTNGMDAQWLDRWLPLRALGGNSVMIRTRSTRQGQGSSSSSSEESSLPLIMFPRIDEMGYELWFHSAWLNGSTMLIEVDVFDNCPMGQFWPKCLWCNRFHLPYEGRGSHRASHQHAKFRANYIEPIVEDRDAASRRQRAAILRDTVREWAGRLGTEGTDLRRTML